MRIVVVFDSKFGNTARIAEAIGRGASVRGDTRVVSTDEAADALGVRPDLLLVGGPTRNHGITAELRTFLDALAAGRLAGTRAAAFDTRYRMVTLLSGSAARDASGRLARAGAEVIAAPESFFMSRAGKPEQQTLEAGEPERAEAWGRRLADAVAGDRAA
jgi:flavodoxin